VNYRLNAFGFLGSDLLRGSDKSTGNFGIQDQRKAMQFIYENAEKLGADKTKIMIFGESAGAGSVANHLVRPQGFQYFTRAAMESGPTGADWVAQVRVQVRVHRD
jgi:carboxylesterase type B